MKQKRNKELVEHIIRNQPYLTYRQAAEITGRCVRTIYNKVYGIRQEIEKGRYPEYVQPGTLINWYALIDYLTYEKDLNDKYRRKSVPPFEPEKIAILCGLK